MTKIITITHKFNEAFSLKIFGKRLEKEHATGKSSEPRSSKYVENFGTEVRNKYCKKEKVLFAGNADHHEVGIVVFRDILSQSYGSAGFHGGYIETLGKFTRTRRICNGSRRSFYREKQSL